MLNWFKKNKKLISIEDQYNALMSVGISLNENINLQQITSDFERREYEEKPYILLLIAMGSEIEKDGEFKFTSTDIWHFDRECIEDDGDYSIVMERIVELIKGELLITDIEDHIDRENEEVGLSFKLNGETYKFNLTLNDLTFTVSTAKRAS